MLRRSPASLARACSAAAALSAAPALAQPVDCIVVPPGAQFESQDPQGCEVSPPSWQMIQCGVPFAGLLCADVGRDTDWVMFTVAAPSTVTLTLRAEFDGYFGFVGDTTGPLPLYPDWCGAVSVVNPFANITAGCTPQAVSATLEPGSYIATISHGFGGAPAPCPALTGTQYLLELTVGTCDSNTDCNGNGTADYLEIAASPSLDCYNPAVVQNPHTIGGPDGQLDVCQCQGNWNRDAAVNSSDISAFLASWLAGAQGGADLDCSGQVNSSDISAFLGVWLGNAAGVPEWSGCP